MSMCRLSFASSTGIRTFASGLMAVAVVASATIFGGSPAAEAAPASKPSGQPGTPFLSLPFAPNANMRVLSGWYYSGGSGVNQGIDYINGGLNSSGGWRTFPVIASADGEACANCTTRQGNAVWIKHNINGQTFYTYYGHLSSIAGGIPMGSQSRTIAVKRGQMLGMAGSTGSPGALHLHYALYNASSTPLDPYGIGKRRDYYPQPAGGNPGIGWFIK